jgi:hypothetical protein
VGRAAAQTTHAAGGLRVDAGLMTAAGCDRALVPRMRRRARRLPSVIAWPLSQARDAGLPHQLGVHPRVSADDGNDAVGGNRLVAGRLSVHGHEPPVAAIAEAEEDAG